MNSKEHELELLKPAEVAGPFRAGALSAGGCARQSSVLHQAQDGIVTILDRPEEVVVTVKKEYRALPDGIKYSGEPEQIGRRREECGGFVKEIAGVMQANASEDLIAHLGPMIDRSPNDACKLFLTHLVSTLQGAEKEKEVLADLYLSEREKLARTIKRVAIILLLLVAEAILAYILFCVRREA